MTKGNGAIKDRIVAMGHKPRRKVGRPTKYTPDRVKRIVDAVRAGNYREVSSRYAGVAPSIFYEWMNIYPEFAESVENAEYEREVALVAAIRTDKAWTAKAWMLERTAPDRWGRHDRLDLGGQKDNPIRVKDETPYDFDAMRATFRRLVGSNGTGGNGAGGNGAEEPVHPAPAVSQAGASSDRLR